MRRFIINNASLIWVIFLVLAVLNGGLRDTLYTPSLGGFWGRIAGLVVLVAAMLVVMWFYLRRQRETLNGMKIILLGVYWVLLSAIVELGFMHYVMDVPWPDIYALYDIRAGNTRGLVLLMMLVGPIVIGARMIGKREAARAAAAGPPPAATAPEAGGQGQQG